MGTTSEKTMASEKATQHSQQLGLPGDEDTASVLNLEKPKQEMPFLKPVPNTRSLALREGRAEGFEAEEELPEQFSDKMRIKTELAKQSKAEGKAKSAALRMPRGEGFSLETERSENFKNNEKNVKTDV